MYHEIESYSKLYDETETAPKVSAVSGNACSPSAVTLKADSDNSTQLAFFVHGTPGAASDWSAVWAELRKRGFDCGVISLDRPGFGANQDWAAAEDWQEQMDCFRSLVLEQVDPEKRLLLVGHSYGAALVSDLARRLAGEVEVAGLVLVSGVLSPLEKQCRWYHRLLLLPLVSGLAPRSYVQSAREMSAVKLRLEKLQDWWSGIEFPVTLVHGDADRLIPIANSKFVQGKMGAGCVKLREVAAGGHVLTKTHPSVIADAIVEIFERIEKREEARNER